MEMEDHHLHHFQEQQQYGMAELRHLVNATRSATPFQALELEPSQPTPDLLSTHRNLSLNPTIHFHQHQQHLEMLMYGRQVADVMPLGPMISTPATAVAAAAAVATNPSITEPVPIIRTSASSPSFSGFEVDAVSYLGGDAYSGRWPRQETLILLEIRSRLDPKFKEANQKGPLWDEVSRIMSEEHGYQRSGKKCREKFENLYKYYKKTKEGKVGRQDGKNYRFFRQLDAIYGGSSSSITATAPESNFIGSSFLLQGATGSVAPSQRNQDNFESTIKHGHSLSLTNTTDFDTSSSDMNELSNEALMEHDSLEKRRNIKSSRRGWQAKIRYFIDSQMKKLMERQEAWLERLMKTVEEKEKERFSKEEEWRKQEAARLERAHKFQARERAWIKSRDAALVEALQKLSGLERNTLSPHVDLMAAEIQNQSENQNGDRSEVHNNNARSVADQCWQESEVARLMQLRYEMEYKFQQSGRSEDKDLWEEVAAKMACLGYEKRSAWIYKDKWESIQLYTRNNKKWKENTNCSYFENIDQPFLYSQDNAYCEMNKGKEQETAQFCVTEGGSLSNSNAGNASSDSCYHLVMADEGESLWKTQMMNLNKLGHQNQ